MTRADVERIANLARLSFSPEEAAAMALQLDAILDYVALLNELDTQGVEPTAHAIPMSTPLREDRAFPGLSPSLALANAPQKEGTAFRVPKVIDGDEG